MSSEHAPAPDRAHCAAHGLIYDPRLASGCVLCVRERAETEAAVRGGGRSLGLLLGALGLVLAALAVAGARSEALARWLGRGGAQAVVGASDTEPEHGRGLRIDRGRPLRVLFVGNSLTSVNDLPSMVAKLAEAAAVPRPFEPHAVTFDGFTLRDHLAANGVATQLASAGPWDAVVLQEQSQRPGWPQSREQEFFASARALDQAIRGAGARTVLYGTMGRRDGDPGNFPDDRYDAMQRRVDEGYAGLAQELHAELVPVGRAWRAMLKRRPELAIWQADGQHPTVAGTYLAACAFYAAFYRQSPVGNRYVADLLPADALSLQDVAALAVLDPGSSETSLAELDTTREDRERHERITATRRAREAAQTHERRERMETDLRAQEPRNGRLRVPVKMYTTSWCGVCKRASAYMHREGIAVREFDVEQDGEARAVYLRLNPRGGVPTIDVDGAVLIGWSEPRFEAMLAEALARRPR